MNGPGRGFGRGRPSAPRLTPFDFAPPLTRRRPSTPRRLRRRYAQDARPRTIRSRTPRRKPHRVADRAITTRVGRKTLGDSGWGDIGTCADFSHMCAPAASIAGMQTPVRILVVDDAEPVRKILVQTLRAMGFDPSQADSGPAALRLVLTAPPDVAIVDQWMPDMTGAELVRLMRSSTDARIRSIRNHRSLWPSGQRAWLLAAGALTFLPKPFRIAQLTAALRLALEPAAPAASSAA